MVDQLVKEIPAVIFINVFKITSYWTAQSRLNSVNTLMFCLRPFFLLPFLCLSLFSVIITKFCKHFLSSLMLCVLFFWSLFHHIYSIWLRMQIV